MMYKVGDDCPQAKYRLDEERDGEDGRHGDHDQRHLLGHQPVRRCTNALFFTLQALVLQCWYTIRIPALHSYNTTCRPAQATSWHRGHGEQRQAPRLALPVLRTMCPMTVAPIAAATNAVTP
jgi:hypothetical protein